MVESERRAPQKATLDLLIGALALNEDSRHQIEETISERNSRLLWTDSEKCRRSKNCFDRLRSSRWSVRAVSASLAARFASLRACSKARRQCHCSRAEPTGDAEPPDAQVPSVPVESLELAV